ncbi:MAG: hypothetical protein ACI389_05230 [Methanobrevibacter sp.]|uniref:hypothetical protein n=1 Tax=Methanobrevibacter sp. TaxID=66852 RepID=UPI003F0CBD64
MNENRFKYRVNGEHWRFIDTLNGDETNQISDVTLLANQLYDSNRRLHKANENISNEIIHFRLSLIEAIHHERTDMGKSSLKQLAKSLGVEY